jgi:hypothetical protein
MKCPLSLITRTRALAIKGIELRLCSACLLSRKISSTASLNRPAFIEELS